MTRKIRVLIVDDSSVIRNLLKALLSSDPQIEVVGTATDPFVARDKLLQLQPDVMTLDIEMPKMDGVTFLTRLMKHYPVRTLIISSLSTRGSEMALHALEAGAVDVMTKPAIDVTRSLTEMGEEICRRVKAVAKAKLVATSSRTVKQVTATSPSALAKTTHQVLAIASSTGGTEALKSVLPYLPSDVPGIVIVQHMPPVFTKAYAEQLRKLCSFEVKEAEHGDRVIPGRALLAPGNYHMELARSGAQYFVQLHQQAALHGVRPAADYLMKSVARVAGANAIGLVLTGMGKDGAQGLLAMKEAGSYNIAQDEESCVVFGMPKVAIELQAIHSVLPLSEISAAVMERFRKTAVVQ